MRLFFSQIKIVFFCLLSNLSILTAGSQTIFDAIKKAASNPTIANIDPSWSPDGEQIVFSSNRNGTGKIYLMNKDGSNPVKLTGTPGNESSPHFSPDGKLILFSYKVDGISQIYTMNKNGFHLINLTQSENNEYNPCWSPSGEKIAFQSERDLTAQIYQMDIDGSNLKRISDHLDYNNSLPKWSPDGSSIAFLSFKPPHDIRNSLANLKNDSCSNVSIGLDWYIFECFSIDGKKMCYHSSDPLSQFNHTDDIYIYETDTKSSKRIKKNIFNMTNAIFVNKDSILIGTREDIYLLDIKTGKTKSVLKHVNARVCAIKNDTILFELSDKKTDVCTVRIDGTEFRNLTQ